MENEMVITIPRRIRLSNGEVIQEKKFRYVDGKLVRVE